MQLNLEGLTQEQINSLKKQIEEFEKENEKPKDIIDYTNGYFIDGGKTNKTSEFYSSWIDNANSLGLYRDTKEECEKLIKKMKIEHRLRQWAKMCKDKVDWSDSEQTKYYICICNYNTSSKLKINCSSSKGNDIYFTDMKILTKAIAEIGRDKLTTEYFVEV